MQTQSLPPKAVAKSLGVHVSTVYRRLRKKINPPPRELRPWEPAELEILRLWTGKIATRALTQKINKLAKENKWSPRTHKAVTRQCQRLAYYTGLDSDTYSLTALAQALRTSEDTVKGWLRVKRYKEILSPEVTDGGHTLFRIPALRKFFSWFPGEVDRCNPDILWLITVMAGD